MGSIWPHALSRVHLAGMLPEGVRRQPKARSPASLRQGASQTFFQQIYAFTLCEYPGLSFQRSPVCACSLVSSLLLSGATMSQQSSLTQSAHSVRQVLTAYTRVPVLLCAKWPDGKEVTKFEEGNMRRHLALAQALVLVAQQRREQIADDRA